MTTNRCPDVAALTALLENDEVEASHLDTCATCQQTLLDLASGNLDWTALTRCLPLVDERRSTRGDALERGIGQLKHELPRLLDASEIVDDEISLAFLPPAEGPGLLGVLGGYEVLRLIGRGGMGLVFKAWDPSLRRLVAIKVMATLIGSANARRRFTREAQAAAAVCHDHIVAIHGVQETNGIPYLVMQYIDGESVQARLERLGALPISDVASIGRQTALALAAAHKRGLIHRDIKPGNLLLENGILENGFERLRITDFGMARMADDVTLTQNGVLAGTPAYMSPEQARGEPCDHRTDLFSLGSVLYALCTGTPPFQGETAMMVLRQVTDVTPTPIRERNSDVPVWLETIIHRLLAKNPADRFQCADEVAFLLANPGAVAIPPRPALTAATQTGSPMARRRAGIYVFVLAVIGGLGLAASFAGCGGKTEETAAPLNLPTVFAQDLRGVTAVPNKLKPHHVVRGDMLRATPEGLAISIPKAVHIDHRASVGVRPDFGLTGDFEITGTFEIVQIEGPPSSYGVGAGIYLRAVPDWEPGANMSRVVRDGVDQGILCNSWGPGGGDNFIPCTNNVLRLRYQRSGRQLTYCWAPDADGGVFKQIHHFDFGISDIAEIRIGAFTAGANCDVIVRLLDLQIRGETTDNPIARVATEPAAPPPRSRRVIFVLIGVVLLMALAAGIRLIVRTRGKRKQVA